jgi:hypothetical protein
MDKEQKEKNRKAQEAADRKHVASDEEFAERMYDENAPTPPQFQEQHDVTYTGEELHE